MTPIPVSESGLRLMRLLVGRPPQTLHQLMAGAGVTRTAVTEQIAVLTASGYIERRVERGGRGRPHHLYQATDAALQLFPTQERRLVPALFEAVEEVAGRELLAAILDRVVDKLTAFYRARISAESPEERLRQLMTMMQEKGVVVDAAAEAGRWVIRERSCPFVNLVGPKREACEVERRMISRLVGADVQMTECRLDHCHGCAFLVQLGPAAKEAAPLAAPAAVGAGSN